jgi:hypothetical protein
MRTSYLNLLALGVMMLSGCATRPEKLAQSRLAKMLGQSGYSLYTPARSEDYPGTIFAYARNTEGKTIELTLSSWNQTFTADTSELFPAEGVPVDIGQKITETNSFNTLLAAEFLKPVLNLSNVIDYIKGVNVEFGSDQRKHVMTLATLEKFRNKFQNDTKAALERFKRRGELDHIYLVLETFSVDSASIELLVKSGFEGKVSVDKIKPLANAQLDVKTATDRQFTLKFSKPMIVGYKAIRFSDAILSGVVSPPPIKAVFLTPEEIEKIKE